MIKHFEHFDKQLIIITLILLSVGSIMLFSASSHYANETFGNHTYFFNKHIIYPYFQYVRLKSTITVKISSLPKSIQKERSHFPGAGKRA